MKLGTELIVEPDDGRLAFVNGSADEIEHDAAAAHALMMAMEEFDGAEYQRDYILHRADELMREWGFDSGEVA